MKRKFPAVIIFFIMLLSIGEGIGQVDKLRQLEEERREKAENVPQSWRIKFKRARHSILLFKTGVNNYYNAVLFQGKASGKEVDMLINVSIAARQSMKEISACPEEYQAAYEIYKETYESLRKMELMAENKHVAFIHLEEQKELKKRVDELIDEFERLLGL